MRDHFTPHTLPADELAAIRAEIQRLRAREAVLRRFFLESGAAVHDGCDTRVVVKTQTRRSFDHTRLPEAVQRDPTYWKTTRTRAVRTLARTEAVPREDEEIDLIEPF